MNARSSDNTYGVKEKLELLRKEMQEELDEILSYWLRFMVDDSNGGFYGKRLYNETLVADAPKSVVLNARILWSFASAARLTGRKEYKKAAERAYNYLITYFFDKEFGGVYWSVNYKGEPFEKKKQVYALSFAMYGLTEYFRLTADENAKRLSLDLFFCIEKYSRDKILGGYIEAFTQDWQPVEDLRLSDKDANEKKTMNTHLHILEAYSNLYRIHPSLEVKQAIVHLLDVFDKHIIDAANHHLILFFDEEWNRKGLQISFGHDIEAAWLLYEAADAISDEKWKKIMRDHSIKIADAASEGIDTDHGMWHEYDPVAGHLIKEKHWWPQSEAMVGFLNAFELSGNSRYLDRVFDSWRFIKHYIKDTVNGEWKWGIYADYSLIITEDKAGFWKCPYHNSRSCIELIHRTGNRPGSN